MPKHTGFSDLDKTTVGGQCGHGSRHGRAGQRVQDDIHPHSIRLLDDLFREVQRPGIHHVRNTQLPEISPFFGGSRRGEHFGLHAQREQNGGQSHTTGSIVYEDAVSCGHFTPDHKTQVGRHVGDGQRSSLLNTQVIRFTDDQVGFGGNAPGHGRRQHPHDHITGIHVFYAIAPRDHFADAFPSEGRRTPRRDRQLAESGQYVTEVQSSGPDADDHFIRAGPGRRFHFKPEIFDRTRSRLSQSVTCVY